MTTRPAALTALFVVALGAAGCASHGDEQNRKVLDEPRPLMPRDSQTGLGPRADAATPEAISPLETALDAKPAPAPPPSPLDRSGWPRIVVTPANGLAPHNPVYFDDLGDPASTAALPDTRDAQPRLEAALRGGYSAGPAAGDNLAHLALDPAKFGLDLLTLPVAVVINPPCQTVTTPPTPSAPR